MLFILCVYGCCLGIDERCVWDLRPVTEHGAVPIFVTVGSPPVSRHPSLVPALPSIIGNIVTGDDAQTQASVCEAWFDLPSRQSPDQIK
ncbi:hypothetical protein Bca52824_070912 [Brassica carinata]|uniref:Uncharacterized protein n=1 Tax=Brassica carinata TaxID=52824 RepID=A0A8X7Q6D8_BRACI|nr:hypothetical protein Bca52824_070912 [Brassica carinata]